MVKYAKYILIMFLFVMSVVVITYGYNQPVVGDQQEVETNFNYINQIFLESSRYTQKDQVDQAVLDAYHDDFILGFSSQDLLDLGFEEMFDTAELTVYFEKDSFSMIVYNKITNYLWSSRPEFQGLSGVREDNTATRNLMNSGLWVDYVRSQNVSSSTISTASLYTLAEAKYLTDGSMTDTQTDPLSPYQLEAGSYSNRRVATSVEKNSNTLFTVLIDLKEIDVKFEVQISLINGTLSVYIPVQTIEEYGDIYKLLSISIFPYLGAAREDNIPGYMMIPDGIGALVRMNKAHNTTFQAQFYGADFGYGSSSIAQLSVPIFGMVHAQEENGYLAEIEEGAEVTSLQAQYWGNNSRYHRIGSKYNVRRVFRYIINKAGDGNDTIDEALTESNFKINYNFLSNQNASYVGMAKVYRARLIERGVLTDNEKTLDNQIPIHLSYIMSDTEKSFIGSTSVVMTTVDDVYNSYQSFKASGITNQQIQLNGWSRDGFVFQAPYRSKIANKSDYQDLFETIKAEGNTVYLDNDYVQGSELTNRISYTQDVAKTLSRLKMERNYRSLNAQVTEVYYIYPEESYKFAQDDLDFYQDLGVSGLYLSTIGSTLFSYYDQQNYERQESMSYYQDIVSMYDQILLSRPNQYFYENLSGYLDMPITNAQYDYYSDLIPLIPLILKGSISYYIPYLNFNAMGEDRLLTMVDFGMNPSYLLTEEDTYKMRYTNASLYYTTTRSDYEEEIIETYEYVNGALSSVIGASISNREVLDTGFVKVTYSNGVMIYVNYNYEQKTLDGQTVEMRDYKVVLG
ncbi:DUF5696 domain-containing protein [Mariniplasma anaerobium]|uniref:Uncharacterized protein n=1 Tax=Mariniplasma anaerobium TaxID=2735436 RepID=A0A7U9XUI4_9MOLU|nr:DUF5696 domain-containing protein [Mariniplasma anaerobium]BCR35795.1 hypothetical protein MPAN_006880 [Mariniplasma anaerobium]